jgi:DNA replication protein DnaC
MLRFSRIPSDFWHCEITKIPETMAYRQQLITYVKQLPEMDKQGKCLFLFGPYGSGKTGAACAIGKEAMRRGGRVIFLSSLELEPIFGKGLDNALREACLKTHFLIFDDVGAEKSVPWSPAWVETIVKLRNNNRLPTIITSNEKPIETCSRIKSIASIFGGRYDAIKVEGIDWRMDPPKE